MTTNRPIENNIISSGLQNSTTRNDGTIISSVINGPQIISSSLTDEIILNGKKFKIAKQIARSGEAEVLLVTQNNSNYIFKYYYSQYKPKDEILKKLKGLKHPDIITLIDFGYYQDRFFEISEYAQGGTLMEIMPVTSIQKIKEIVEETIEALSYCHNHGIIHRDIKPENIFYRTVDKKDIAIGDFGIASNIREGEELIQTSSGRTDLYAAPEIFTNIKGKTIIEKSVDYYALGMTILHLWFGKNPFDDLDEFSIMRVKSEGRVGFPENIDKDVEKLIKGLITVNPHDRWGYNEVKQWLKGEAVKVLYQTIKLDYKPYSFGLIEGKQIVVNNPKDIALYLEKYPDKGEGHLYRNTIAKWIEPVDQGLFNELMDIVEKDYPRDRNAGLTKAIYILDREMPFTGYDKTILITKEEIALYFEKNFSYYQKDLQNPNAAFYLFLEARELKNDANKFRKWFSISKDEQGDDNPNNLTSTLIKELKELGGSENKKTYKHHSINGELALNTLILYLQGSDKFIIDNYTLYQPEELIKVDNNTKTKIINQLSNINSKLSLWISSFKNLQHTIDKWRVLKRYDETTLRYALQKGFELNGNIANGKSEFLTLFNNNFSYFIYDSNASKSQNEANYWLKNYIGSSLQEFLIDFLISQELGDINEFEQIFNYIIKNVNNSIISNNINKQTFKGNSINVITLKKSQLIERLNVIGKELEPLYNNNSIGNDKYISELKTESNSLLKQIKDLENKIKDENIFTNVSNSIGNNGFNLYDTITKLLSIIKVKIIHNHELFNKVIDITKEGIEKNWVFDCQTNSILFLDCLKNYLSFVEKNINSNSLFFSQLTLKLDNKIYTSIRLDIDKIKNNENQFKSYCNDLAKIVNRLKKINPELPYLMRYENEIEEINNQTKLIKAKIQIDKKDKVEKLNYEYEKILKERRNNVSKSFQLRNWDKDQYEWIMIIFAISGLLLSIFGGIKPAFDKGDILEGILQIIIGAPILIVVAVFIGWIISLIVRSIGESNAISKGRKDAENAVALTSQENAAYTQSSKEIERFFSEKEAYEILQEKVRILSLDEQQFEKEFIKLINNQKQVEKERLEKEKAKEKMIERQEILKREEEELLLRNRFLESLKTSKEFFEAYKTGNEIEINKVKEKLFEEFVKK